MTSRPFWASCSALVLVCMHTLAPQAAAQHSGLVFGRELEPGRRMRGDWEPPDVLLVAYHAEWDRELTAIVTHAAREVPVQILMPADEVGLQSVDFKNSNSCIQVTPMELDSPWVRDFGPIQVFEHEQVTWLDFIYDPDRQRDDLVPWHLADRMRVKMHAHFEFLDGGAVVSNGRGLCVMTDESLRSTGLEPYTRHEVEAFTGRMGCEVTAIVPALPNEQTGHADVVVQFFGPDIVGVAELDPVADPQQAAILDETAWAVQRAAHAQGRHVQVIRVPMLADDDVFYSYLNGVRVGALFLVPAYAQVPAELQRAAYAALEQAMPRVQLVPIVSDESAELGGAVHCLTLGLNLPSTRRQLACRPAKHRQRVRHAALKQVPLRQ